MYVTRSFQARSFQKRMNCRPSCQCDYCMGLVGIFKK